MKTKRALRHFTSLLLVFVMIFGMIPGAAFAEGLESTVETTQDQISEDPIVIDTDIINPVDEINVTESTEEVSNEEIMPISEGNVVTVNTMIEGLPTPDNLKGLSWKTLLKSNYYALAQNILKDLINPSRIADEEFDQIEDLERLIAFCEYAAPLEIKYYTELTEHPEDYSWKDLYSLLFSIQSNVNHELLYTLMEKVSERYPAWAVEVPEYDLEAAENIIINNLFEKVLNDLKQKEITIEALQKMSTSDLADLITELSLVGDYYDQEEDESSPYKDIDPSVKEKLEEAKPWIKDLIGEDGPVYTYLKPVMELYAAAQNIGEPYGIGGSYIETRQIDSLSKEQKQGLKAAMIEWKEKYQEIPINIIQLQSFPLLATSSYFSIYEIQYLSQYDRNYTKLINYIEAGDSNGLTEVISRIMADGQLRVEVSYSTGTTLNHVTTTTFPSAPTPEAADLEDEYYVLNLAIPFGVDYVKDSLVVKADGTELNREEDYELKVIPARKSTEKTTCVIKFLNNPAPGTPIEATYNDIINAASWYGSIDDGNESYGYWERYKGDELTGSTKYQVAGYIKNQSPEPVGREYPNSYISVFGIKIYKYSNLDKKKNGFSGTADGWQNGMGIPDQGMYDPTTAEPLYLLSGAEFTITGDNLERVIVIRDNLVSYEDSNQQTPLTINSQISSVDNRILSPSNILETANPLLAVLNQPFKGLSNPISESEAVLEDEGISASEEEAQISETPNSGAGSYLASAMGRDILTKLLYYRYEQGIIPLDQVHVNQQDPYYALRSAEAYTHAIPAIGNTSAYANDGKVYMLEPEAYSTNAGDVLPVGDGGGLLIGGLGIGTYTLTETKAPDGYVTCEGPMTIEMGYMNEKGEFDPDEGYFVGCRITENGETKAVGTTFGWEGALSKNTTPYEALMNPYCYVLVYPIGNDRMSLLVDKEVINGDEVDDAKDFNFEITLKDSEGNICNNVTYAVVDQNAQTDTVQYKSAGTIETAYNYPFTLKNGESLVFTNLLEETVYEITEIVDQNEYLTEVNNTKAGERTLNGEEVEAVEGGIKTTGKLQYIEATYQTIHFTNEPCGELEVGKTVEGEDGDQTKDFNFIVSLDDDSIEGTYGELEFHQGVAEFTLKHGETKHAPGLPNGIQYTVTEKEANTDNYKTTSTGEQGSIPRRDKASANFINTRDELDLLEEPEGNLTVSKTVTGNSGDYNQNFNFTVELSDPSINETFGPITFVNGKASFTLKHKESVEIIGLPAGVNYTVTETEANKNGYKTTAVGDKGTIEADRTSTAAFVNSKDTTPAKPGTGNLTVSKTVSGNSGETKKDFHFTVTLSDNTITSKYGDVSFNKGVGTFTLKHGETKQVRGLPQGVSYTVTETEADKNGYKTTKNGDKGTIVSGTPSTAAFVNARDEFIEETVTGNLTVSKTVTGNAGETNRDFNFTVTLSDRSINERFGSVKFTNGVATFTLKHGKSKEITGLPDGINYTVTEKEADQEGYKTTKLGSNGTISPDTPATAAFINQRDTQPIAAGTGNLTVSKTVTGNSGEYQRDFHFTVALSDTTINAVYGDVAFVNGVATFTLKHGENKQIPGLPAGINYTITESEANQNGYVTRASGDKGTINSGADSTAAFINNRSPNPSTGIDNYLNLWGNCLLFSVLGLLCLILISGRSLINRN